MKQVANLCAFSRMNAMIHCKKFLSVGRCFVVCCLALSGTLAFAQVSKTLVRHAVGHAVSRSLRELPIDVLGLRDVEAPEPKPLPMSARKIATLSKADELFDAAEAKTAAKPAVQDRVRTARLPILYVEVNRAAVG